MFIKKYFSEYEIKFFKVENSYSLKFNIFLYKMIIFYSTVTDLARCLG